MLFRSMRPKKALGKPKSAACQELPTAPQLIAALMLQLRSESGLAAKAMASTAKTKEATKLITAENSIVEKIQIRLLRNSANFPSGLKGATSSFGAGDVIFSLSTLFTVLRV